MNRLDGPGALPGDAVAGGAPAIPDEGPTWTARRVQPIVVLYVVGVFVAYMAVAYFVLHSTKAVGALATAAVGTVVAMMPAVLGRQEYRLTASGLEKRPHRSRRPGTFKAVFGWEELAHLKSTGTGYKYAKTLDEPRPLARFWKRHLSEDFNGEFQVERGDRERVRTALAARAVPITGTTTR